MYGLGSVAMYVNMHHMCVCTLRGWVGTVGRWGGSRRVSAEGNSTPLSKDLEFNKPVLLQQSHGFSELYSEFSFREIE